MRVTLRLFALLLIATGLLAGTASAKPDPDPNPRKKMDEIFTSPNMATNSDFAFWGNHAFSGYYTGDTGSPAGSGPRGGVRIFDISNPASPKLVKDLQCDANQNDPIVWDRNGNGVADLLLVAVDRTMANPNCGAPRSAHDDRNGWEGVRIFTMSDNPANPFATITPVKMQYTDCGAHTITAWTGFAEDPVNPRLIVYACVVPAARGADLRSGELQQRHQPVRPGQGRQRPAAPPDPGVVGAAEQPGGDDRDRRPEDQLPGRSRWADGLDREGPDRPGAGSRRMP